MNFEFKNMDVQDLFQQLKNNRRNVEIVSRAWDFALKAHKGQKRLSGEDYIIHPLSTAYTLARIGLDAPTVAAALLHDVADDTPITIQDIEKEFGKEIAFLVNGVTKLGKIKYRGKTRQIENLRKMFLAMAEDIRVILIKIADRLHNMETLSAVPERKYQRIALETLEIYAPLANRLGMGELKGRLEDLAFPYVYPEEYRWLMDNVKERYEERKKYLKKVEPILEEILLKEQIVPVEINSRAKHYFSLYRKLIKNDMDFDKIYDLVALRVILKNIDDCYAALGIIHQRWRPLLGRIKDYIALPKPNGYQSLHTTIFCVGGKITEIQLRTPEMHERAEYGIAAHWAYSEKGKPKSGTIVDSKELAWVGQLTEWQSQLGNPEEFLESLKIDFFKDRIFVFTPKGDVIDLPEGATPVDFAYQIHSEIGHQCAGARINGKVAPLNYGLKNGDVIEILVQRNKKPSASWLDFVKTNTARDRIKTILHRKRILLPSAPESLKIKVISSDRIGLIKDVSSAISNSGINILNFDSVNQDIDVIINATIEIKNKLQMERLMKKIKEVKGVKKIETD